MLPSSQELEAHRCFAHPRACSRADGDGTKPTTRVAGSSGDGTVTRPATTRDLASFGSWNGNSYECYLCHRTFKELKRLNQHLRSPAHAHHLYRCPVQDSGCGAEFSTLPGEIWKHMENGRCGVRRLRVQSRVDANDSFVLRTGVAIVVGSY